MTTNLGTKANIRSFAPILLFAFNRPDHTAQTLNALKCARYAEQSELYVFIDGPRSESDELKINETKTVIEAVSGFKDIQIIQRRENLGLAQNIVEGISSIINENGRAIVLEDDIVVSKGFLVYMNEALNRYESENTVWHIGGYNEAIDIDDDERTFFLRLMYCWGWATWKDRWQHYEKDTGSVLAEFSKQDIHRFNLEGCEDFYSQILANHEERINTWAIFWYATIFRNNGLCLNPAVSLVQNIGFDGTGVHCGSDGGKHTLKRINTADTFRFPTTNTEDRELLEMIKSHYRRHKPTPLKRIHNRLVRVFG